MWLAMKRRSWQIVLPHMGEPRAGTYWARKASIWAAALASSTVEALTRSIRPLRPWVPLFHASMASRTSSLWCTAITGPSTRTVIWGSVTTTAISMMRSVAGSSPVISMSSQTRFWSLRGRVSLLMGSPCRPGFSDIGLGGESRDVRQPAHPRLHRGPGHVAGAAPLAVEPPDPPRRPPPRGPARRLRRHRERRGPPQGGRLHHRPPAPGHLGGRLGRRGAAGLDAAGRPGRPQPGSARSGPRLVRRPGLPARPADRLQRDLWRAGPALRVVAHFPAGAALRLQPHRPAHLAGRHGQGLAGQRADRPAAGRAGAVADGPCRLGLVAVGLLRPGRLQ